MHFSIAQGFNPRILNFEGAQLLPKETPIKISVMHFSIAWGFNPRLLKRNQTKFHQRNVNLKFNDMHPFFYAKTIIK